MKNKIKNPLRKRVVRELLGDWRKYLVVFLFLVLTIGFVSGMYVANESMMSANRSGAEKYKLEYGHFELHTHAQDAQITPIAPPHNPQLNPIAHRVCRQLPHPGRPHLYGTV